MAIMAPAAKDRLLSTVKLPITTAPTIVASKVKAKLTVRRIPKKLAT
jgi:hypothetical protein